MSPFLLACGSGLSDVVVMLVRRGLGASHEDNKGRGALQRARGSAVRARGSAGEGANLESWLLANAKDSEGRPLEMTYGEGRAAELKRTGKVGRQRRHNQWLEQRLFTNEQSASSSGRQS